MTRCSRTTRVVAMIACAATLVPFMGTPAAAVSVPEAVAEFLDNPYKMTFGPDGALYVVEAGTGGQDGETRCLRSAEGGDLCLGLTGAVTRVDLAAGTQERVATGLPSLSPPGTHSHGDGAIGAADVAVDDEGNLFVVVGFGGDAADRASLGSDGEGLGTVMKVTPQGDMSVFADLLAFEEADNPDADRPGAAEPDSNPFGIELNPDGGFWAVDAGGNDVLSIDETGAVSLEAVLPFGMADAPPFLGLPPGTKIPYQPVPTSITAGAVGLLVTQLTGFPFPVGGSNIYSLNPDTSALTVTETGFTNVVDAAQGSDGSVYVLEFSTNGLLTTPPISRLTQIRPDGTRKVLLQDEIGQSNGVVVGPDGMVYVSVGSRAAAVGGVIRVDPNEARDPATAAACEPEAVPGAGFSDVGGNLHRETIDCLAWWDVVEGRSPTIFQPRAMVRRDQVASILTRLLEAAEVTLPEDPPDAFTDDDGNVHEENVNALAALDVARGQSAALFAPSAFVTRGQAASLLARAYEAASGTALPDGPDAFDDDDGTPHEAAINAVTAAGWANGRAPGTFDPGGNASRAQLSSMVARTLGTLVEEGIANLPG